MSQLIAEVPDDWLMLILRPVRDPIRRTGGPERRVSYRHKLLVKRCERSFGLHVETYRSPLIREIGPGVCPRCMCRILDLELSE